MCVWGEVHGDLIRLASPFPQKSRCGGVLSKYLPKSFGGRLEALVCWCLTNSEDECGENWQRRRGKHNLYSPPSHWLWPWATVDLKERDHRKTSRCFCAQCQHVCVCLCLDDKLNSGKSNRREPPVFVASGGSGSRLSAAPFQPEPPPLSIGCWFGTVSTEASSNQTGVDRTFHLCVRAHGVSSLHANANANAGTLLK